LKDSGTKTRTVNVILRTPTGNYQEQFKSFHHRKDQYSLLLVVISNAIINNCLHTCSITQYQKYLINNLNRSGSGRRNPAFQCLITLVELSWINHNWQIFLFLFSQDFCDTILFKDQHLPVRNLLDSSCKNN